MQVCVSVCLQPPPARVSLVQPGGGGVILLDPRHPPPRNAVFRPGTQFRVARPPTWKTRKCSVIRKMTMCSVVFVCLSVCVSNFCKRRSVAKNVRCFQRNLFVYVWVCQHDNFRMSKCRMMKLWGQVHRTKILAGFKFGGHSPMQFCVDSYHMSH